MRNYFSSVAILLTIFSQLTLADFPIRQSSNGDVGSAIAYNSTDHEYLVVWSEYTKLGSFYITGPIMGQRVSENGNAIGSAFTIFTTGSLPSVAYNSKKNEYLVVCATLVGIYGQRIDNSGNLIETSSELDWEHVGNWPKVVYNYLTEDYLLVMAALQENPLGSGFYNIKIFGKHISSIGQPMGLSWLIEDTPYGINEYGISRFALAYAPIQSNETPKGRYLLAVQTNNGINLTMLNQWGYPLDVVYDPQSQQYFRYIPFNEGSVVGGEFSVDVAFGMKAGYNLPGPAFFVVWGDNNNTWDGQQWSGIYGSFVDPYKLNYLATDPVQDNVFPISAIYDHYAFGTDEYAKSWNPKVAYNNVGQKFMVTWRETPTTNSQNDTKVNHIRADKEYTGGSFYNPNNVISAISGNENPMEPALASSTANPTALITWNDYRNFSTTDWDIYGNLYSIPSVPSITVTKPSGGEDWFIDTEYEITWTSNDYTNPVRIEYSTDGGATYIEIINSTPNDGLYMWTIPFTLSNYCVVRILDATDSDPFDISDQVFSITTTKKIVTNTNDSGLGSFRQAIIEANADPGKDTIIFKIPGKGIHTIRPLSEFPAITDPVLIDGFSQPGSSPNTNPMSQGCNANLNIELDGSSIGSSSYGLHIIADNSTIRGLIINRFYGNGITIDTYGNNIISGNFIGISHSGLEDLGNSRGIYINNVPDNLIGGILPEDRNIISGNSVGVHIENTGATGNKIQGNYFGIDITGLNEVGQSQNIIINNAPSNYIGGSIEGARNIISGSGGGSMSYDPPWAGITIMGVSSTNNIVQGNYIGTDATGFTAIPNHQAGISILSNANIIGGSSINERNIISGNGEGIYVRGDYNIISGNLIGINASSYNQLGNAGGISIKGRNNTIGGITSSEANVIAFNITDGIRIISDVLGLGYDAIGNRILTNSIFHNGGLGINLSAWYDSTSDVTSNDLNDTDTGPNNLQNYPVLTKVEVDIGTFITGSLNSSPNTNFRIDFFSSPVGDLSGYGEGQTPIGWTEVTTDVNGNVDFYVSIGVIPPAGHVITSTATDPDGNTSEFSNWIKTPAPTTYVVNNTNDSGTGSLRQAIIDANNNPGLDSIAFNIPGTGPFTIQPTTELPEITDPLIIDGYSQPGSHPNIYPISEGSNANIMIELSGEGISSAQIKTGLNIKSGSSTVRGLVINRFNYGIIISENGGNKIEGNFIGTDITASTSLANDYTGIYVDSTNNNKIGGTKPQDRNIISGNYTGIQFWYGMNNTIQGNYVGIDASGTLYLANSYGIWIKYSQACLVGGSEDGAENIISSNGHLGLVLDNSSYNSIQKNIVGLDRTGTIKLGSQVGIELLEHCSSNYILANKVGGNTHSGIWISDSSKYNVISDNLIGTDENWQYNLGNNSYGIYMHSSPTSQADEYNSIENNYIGFNGISGIQNEYSKYNTISRNLISKNGGKGIENDLGGNNELSPPIINSVNSTAVTGSAGVGYRIEVFSDDEDEGRYYLGSTTADGSGNFIYTLTEPIPLQHITATCTDLEGNTSEFSAPFVVTGVEDEKNKIPTEFTLYQNFPNPFNPTTKITYAIPLLGGDEKGGLVTLKVYDVLGDEVRTLVSNEMEAGYHSVDFKAGDLPSGVYFYRLIIGDFIDTKKMIFTK